MLCSIAKMTMHFVIREWLEENLGIGLPLFAHINITNLQSKCDVIVSDREEEQFLQESISQKTAFSLLKWSPTVW